MTKTAIISIDGHVKGSRDVFREYVPQAYRERYDRQVDAQVASGARDAGNLHPDLEPAVQWDSDLRTSKLETAGVVAEVLFPNGQPFQVNPFDDHATAETAELADVGRQAYNRWLADFCAQEPDRRRGQLSSSFRDVDRAVAEIYWAKENGLGGIGLPGVTRKGRMLFDRELDPIWAACEETGLVVSQHGGGLDPEQPQGSGGAMPEGFGAFMVIATEMAFWANRSLWQMIAAGVFDRFPGLRASWVETQVFMTIPIVTYLDQVLDPDWLGRAGIDSAMDRRFRDYFGENVFIGLSPFTPRQDPSGDVFGFDRDGEVRPGFHLGIESLMYGVDFPHFETCFQRNMVEVATLCEAPFLDDDQLQDVFFDTAADLYSFDVDVLQPHVERVGFDIGDVRARADQIRADNTEPDITDIFKNIATPNRGLGGALGGRRATADAGPR